MLPHANIDKDVQLEMKCSSVKTSFLNSFGLFQSKFINRRFPFPLLCLQGYLVALSLERTFLSR